MAFCFDDRDAAMRQLAERSGVNYRHHFVKDCGDNRFAIYLTIDPVPGYRIKTVASVADAFDFLEILETCDGSDLAHVLHADEMEGHAYDLVHFTPGESGGGKRERALPLAWETDPVFGECADAGFGLYSISPHTSFRSRPRYTAYHHNYAARHVRINALQRCHSHLRPPHTFASPDACARTFTTSEEAKAACQYHFGMGLWSTQDT